VFWAVALIVHNMGMMAAIHNQWAGYIALGVLFTDGITTAIRDTKQAIRILTVRPTIGQPIHHKPWEWTRKELPR
jgi:hypothetical protein